MVEKSIAVLPFQNLSSAPENAYFAAGIQEAVLTDLAKIADLKVINRTSVQHYSADAPRDLREISEQLQVAYVLEGSVQRVGDRVRVTAKLTETGTNTQHWAERYDRDLGGCFRDPKRDRESHRAAIACLTFAGGRSRGAEGGNA